MNDKALRIGGGAVVVLVVAVLLVQIGRTVSEPEAADPAPDVTEVVSEDGPSGVTVRATAPVRVRIERDGAEEVAGVLCRDLECSVSVEHAAEIAVELTDLTRAAVIYNGSRVEPLGNLSAPRRLVFIDD